MIELNDIQKYQLDFCFRYPVISISQENHNNFDEFQKNNDKFVCLYRTEVFKLEGKLDSLEKKIYELSKQSKEIYIAQATTSKLKYGLDPLINLIYWKGFKSRQTISCDWDNDYLFDENRYNEIPKTNKGIISVRKRTSKRNYLFSNINDFDGIFRYSNWPPNAKEEEKEKWLEKVNLNNFPNWYDLINEYKSSYFSFVIESGSGLFLNQCSEKTIIALLTKTVPIVLGGRGYVKELEDMGFWIANEELGIDIDNLPTESKLRMDIFSEGIHNYNKMTMQEVKNFYEKNKDKIEKNFKIMSFFVFGKRDMG